MTYQAIDNVTLIDGTAAAPQAGAAILICDKRIETVGPTGTVPYPEECVVYDAEGKVALPGMIDAHLHTAYTGDADLMKTYLKDLPSFFAIRATVHARNLLHAGITTVRDGGSLAYVDIALRQAIMAGLVQGPRIRACGYGLKMTGGHGDASYSTVVEIAQPGLANSPDEARKVARTNLKLGADHIKIISCSGGVMTAGSDPGAAQFTIEEMRAAIDVAHKAGKRAMAHAHGTQAIKNAIMAGIDSVEHGSYLDDEAIEMMLKNGTFLVPTLLAVHRIIQYGETGGIPEYAVQKAKSVRDNHMASFGRALEAGVKIAMGTDAGTPYNVHGENLNELPLMVQGGMTPMQAIVASTRMGAELLDLDNQVGTLVPGKLADLIVMDGNPLEDINLFKDAEKIVHVMKEGQVVRSTLSVAHTDTNA